MLRGVFNRATAYVGLATGFFGILSVVGPFVLNALGTTVILASVLTTVWVLLVGYRLVRLG
jgi:ABC-type bacteriocin/lantibiotic exporter with double-glycine peptidase domain